ncbi:MAG TPA: hypothetical protein VHY79_20220 [Rhizomicrobium sp.]|jgi:hypothetical protein|nr:hypothetical protein [Rhizomicrobium sp.]
MSVADKAQIARRPLLKGLAGAAGLAIAGAALVEVPKLLAPHHPSSPYDDLLAQLPDRDSAARIGAAYLAGHRTFDATAAATNLRRKLASHSFATALETDMADAHMAEAHGWVLPEILLALCALAAKAG